MPINDVVTGLMVQYGFQAVGALIILFVGLRVARWVAGLSDQWLSRQDIEPPVRKLLTRVIRLIVLLFMTLIVLQQFGVQILPLIAGVGIAGVGLGGRPGRPAKPRVRADHHLHEALSRWRVHRAAWGVWRGARYRSLLHEAGTPGWLAGRHSQSENHWRNSA